MDKRNLYWHMYLSLENEFFKIADIVLIDDKQRFVYSLKNADLLVNVAVQIEAIAKYLYFENGGPSVSGRDLFFDTDCIQHLQSLWNIEAKEVEIVSSAVMLSDELRVMKPLEKCSERGKGKWKKAYQAVKHDRVEKINKATIENLLYALAALYLLNVYSRKEIVALGSDSSGSSFNKSLGSKLFAVRLAKMNCLAGRRDELNYADGFQACAYRVKNEALSFEAWCRFNDEIARVAVDRFKDSVTVTKQKLIQAQISELNSRGLELKRILDGLRYEAVVNTIVPQSLNPSESPPE